MAQIVIMMMCLSNAFLFAGEKELRSRSQTLQRGLPRPVDINTAILRPKDLETPMTELQKVSKK